MNNRRVRAIELSQTPQQVVMVWLRNALQAGSLEESAWHSSRSKVANEIYDTVRNSMKGQPEPLVERAIRQAQREADLLYLIIMHLNTTVFENWQQRQREYVFLFGYLVAEIHGNLKKERIAPLRLVVKYFSRV